MTIYIDGVAVTDLYVSTKAPTALPLAPPYDLPSAAVPTPAALGNQGYKCAADYTFGTTGGTIKTMADLQKYFATLLPDGTGAYTVNHLNDEWEYYDFIDGTTHVLGTDHLTLNAAVVSQTLFKSAVARALATTVPVEPNHPDGHYWGVNQDPKTGSWDSGIRSGCLSARKWQHGGYFEVSLKHPAQLGSWPGFWMIAGGQEWPPELDPDESVNSGIGDTVNVTGHRFHPNAISADAFWAQKLIVNKTDQWGLYNGGFDSSADFHTYGLMWNPTDSNAVGDRVQMFVDQVLIWDGYFPWKNSTGPAGPAVFMIDNAYGGDWPGRGGGIAAKAMFPVGLDIKWLRMFAN